VVHENNQLHVQLIREAERLDAQQTAHYKSTKELESEISVLSFWKHQALDRLASHERDSRNLRDRLAELLKLGEG